MAAPTAQAAAKLLLLDLGIVSLDPASPADQANVITSTDLISVANYLTQAHQECSADENGEPKTQPGSGFLHGPTAVSLTVTTQGGTAISGLTTYAAWMLGCTIRINGDQQDNEIVSSTKLARPFLGIAGATTAVVYADAITFDETVAGISGPILLSSGQPISEATSRQEFVTRSGWPMWTGGYTEYPGYWNLPYWTYGQKPTGCPLYYFTDGYFDPTLDYVPRRIRLSPMPTAADSLAFCSLINPPRITVADIDTVDHSDPGVKIPVINGWVESLFLPIARQLNTANPRFKNDGMRAEIFRQYEMAKRRLSALNLSSAPAHTLYT